MPDGTDALLDIAEKYRGDGSVKVDDSQNLEWRERYQSMSVLRML